MFITVKLELNGRKLGYPKHRKQESYRAGKIEGSGLHPRVGKIRLALV